MPTRREMLQGLSLLPLMMRESWAERPLVTYHDSRGSNLLTEALNDAHFWDGALVNRYQDLPYDEIRLKGKSNGYVAYITGTGNRHFVPDQVAEGIFKYQDLIPQFMPALKSARYIGRGVDARNGLEYTDIYFLADIKVFYMSVPLRTYKVEIGPNRYICAIELITEPMVPKEKWAVYQEIIGFEQEQATDRWSFLSIVPMDYVYGFYLMEPEKTFGTRVTMITQMKFASNVNLLADIGSELPFVLRQGMQAGFVGSVLACQRYLQMSGENE